MVITSKNNNIYNHDKRERLLIRLTNEKARDMYLDLLLENPNSSLSERRRAINNLISFLDSIDISITELATEHLDVFVNNLVSGEITGNPLSANTIQQKMALNKTFVRFLYERKFIDEHPDRIFTKGLDLRLPKVKELLPKYISQKDIQLLLENCSDRYQALLYLAYDTGARISEILSVKILDISFETSTITITEHKTNSFRKAFLSNITIQKLNYYLDTVRPKKESDFLFINSYGKPFVSRTIQIFLKDFSEKLLGHKITPHYFRAACATHMLENGAGIREVQVIVGWKSIQTVERYTRIIEKRQAQVKSNTHPLEKVKTDDKR